VKYDPLWLGAAIATLVAIWHLLRTRRGDPVATFAMAWGGAATAMIASNGARLFLATYFLLPLAPLAIMLAWLLDTAVGPARRYRPAAAIAAVSMLVLVGAKNYPGKLYSWLSADVEQLAGGGNRTAYLQRFGGYNDGRPWSARADDEVNRYIREHSAPDALVYQFGINDSDVYFAADRLPAAKFLRVNMFVPSDFPAPDFQLASVAATLAARRPEYLIFEHFQGGDPVLVNTINGLQQAPALGELLSAYRVETQIEDFTLYRRIR